jgi:Flp pilus assembly protein TadD
MSVNDWSANSEAGVADFLLRSATSRDYRPTQKRVIADEALARLEKAEKLSPDFHELRNLKGSALMMLGRYEQAAQSYSRAISAIPSPELYTNLATAYMALEEKQKAKECLDLALGYAPRYGKARQALKFLKTKR